MNALVFNLYSMITVLAMNFKFDVSSLKQTLPLMITGLIGIFVVICAIWLVVYLLNKASASKKPKDKKDEDNK